MTIKAKLSLGLLFMFAIILALGGLGAYYLNQLASDARAILKDNYISLEFTGAMQKALLDYKTDPNAFQVFEQNLRKQERNVTEEEQLTQAVRRDFNRLKSGNTDSLTFTRLRNALLQIDEVNRQAMVRKNSTAEQTANDALVWLAFVGTLCFLVVFSFIINFPGYIANPLRELTRGIKQVASRNFEERLHFQSSDEFGELARSFNSMAQKLDEYEHSNLARVLFEKKRIDTLIQLMSDGILGLDEHRRVLFANPVACRLLGMNEAQLLGKYAPDVASVNDLMRTLIQELMADEPLSKEGRLLKIYDVDGDGTGKENYFNKQIHTVEVTRTGEEQSQLAGYVIVLKNITPYQERDLAKTNFIATVSHELKTPISGIKLSLKLLEDYRIGALNDEQKQLVTHVRDDADRLLTITGELLNMAQVESGQIQLQFQRVAPGDIVAVATNALRAPAEQKQIGFDLSVPANLHAIKADPDKASWVLINFLSNAVRHSPESSRIEVSVTDNPASRMIDFRVRDYGAGIRPEHQARVFDRYFKAPGRNGQASGTGLGLAISSEFIQSMNGTIGLDTSVTNGAAFYFSLPYA